MKTSHKEKIDLPFEVGKTYTTRFATGEKYTITKIQKNKNGEPTMYYGIYEKCPYLGECPLNIGRLIPIEEYTGIEYEVEVCPHCKKDIV